MSPASARLLLAQMASLLAAAARRIEQTRLAIAEADACLAAPRTPRRDG